MSTQGERLVRLEAQMTAKEREDSARMQDIAGMRAGISENNKQAASIKLVVLDRIDINHKELLKQQQESHKEIINLLNHQDQSIDEIDTRVTAMENQKKGAIAVLSGAFAVVGALVAWFNDAFWAAVEGGVK